MVGYVGIIVSYRNISLDKSNFIMLSNESNNTRIYVPVIDRRRPVNFKKYPHVLGVCVLPLFHYYDYLELIRYIESLLMHGATYFYFYHQSSTFNILKVIDYYKINAKNVTFEIVDWSLLPETNANPNDYIHRLEPSLAIFDCMYRGRYVVQFAAQLDLDEVVAMNTSKYSSLTDYLMMSSKKDNKIASYSFRSSRARLYKETTTLEELKKQKFNNYKSIKLTYPHPRPVYTKLIYRPEYMFNFYIHFPLETDYLLNETYSHYNLSLSEGTIHHFRIINNKRHFKKYLERKSNYYSSKIKQLNSNLSQHLTKLFLIDEKQLPQIKKAVQQYNLCRYEEYLKGKTGLVPFTCRNIMSHEITKNFIVSIHSWLVI
uniref:Glycosyltransferase family 92 protein n=1 Tax=Rhabditophanes sp. KR3021 TaxID=114890 RepID=A0AC35TYG3_9BILA